MARYTGPVCRLCRRERTKLFLKGERCYSMKCPVSEAVTDRHSRAYPPGEHGRDRMRQGSEYLGQLREKQKARRIYGLLEKQFHNLYVEASRAPGITGENLLVMLELRLDNVAFRAGWGASRSQARQFVRHGHVLVNGKRVTIPSYRLRQGSEYLGQLREKQKARRIYGLLERQFHNLYVEASRAPGITGENLLRMLEQRLDNVAFRAGWGASRSQARQFVRHGHVLVNGKRVTIPSYRVRLGDVIALKPSSRELFHVRRNMDTLDRQLPPWLETVGDRFEVRVFSLPLREHIDEPVQEQLIVELYSK